MNSLDTADYTKLMDTVIFNDEVKVQLLLEQKADPSITNTNGTSALTLALDCNNVINE